jgi:hypothetical protein
MADDLTRYLLDTLGESEERGEPATWRPEDFEEPVDEAAFARTIQENAAPTKPSPEPMPATPREGAAAPAARPTQHAVNVGAVAGPQALERGAQAGALRAAERGAEAERDRERGLGGAALFFRALGGLTGAPLGGMVGGALDAGRSLVSDENRRRVPDLKQEIEQGAERERAGIESQRAADRQAIMDAAGQEQQRTENELAQRRVAAQEAGVASLSGHRANQSLQGQGRLDLARDTQEWREEDAALRRTAAERRARINAGQNPDGGAIERPGAAPGPDGAPVAGVHPDALMIQNFLNTRRDLIRPMAEAEAAATGRPVEDVEWGIAVNHWNQLPEKQKNQLRATMASPETSTHAVTHDEHEAAAGESHRIGGWTRSPDAPRLGQAERTEARSLAGAIAELSQNTREMERLAREVSAGETAAARANLYSERAARAQALHESITVRLRQIGHYGVPQNAEMERMAALAPPIASAQTLVGTAPNHYRAIRGVAQQGAAHQMRAWGYEQGGGGGVSPGQSTGNVGGWTLVGRTAAGDFVYERNGQRRVRRAPR